MPGWDGTGPWGLGPRFGWCFGGGLLWNIGVIVIGGYLLNRLLFKGKKER